VDAALVDDEARGQTLGLEEGSKRGGVVVLVPRGAPLGVVLANLGMEGVVVGDVGGEAADLCGGVASEVDDSLELLCGCEVVKRLA
jgi:hypothetical protein